MPKPKQRVPRMDEQWSTLVSTTARIMERLRPSLSNPDATMTILQSDGAWLAELLNEIIVDKDVRQLFFKTISNRPRLDGRDYFMAWDVKRMKSERVPDSYGVAAKRWKLANGASVKRILGRKKFRQLPALAPALW
jgi:hypothetical protein